MAYQYSGIDRSNLAWFDKDTSKATLIKLEIRKGNLRGLSDQQLHFRYPITAFSGKNGTGKSTLLACVACGFHNRPSGYKPLSRRVNYYTFSDFFVQTSEEIPPKGILVAYQFPHHNFPQSPNHPSVIGF